MALTPNDLYGLWFSHLIISLCCIHMKKSKSRGIDSSKKKNN